MADQPTEWNVEDGLLVCYILVDVPPVVNERGILGKPTEGWLHWAQDLRDVTTIRVAQGDKPTRTALYVGADHIATVNMAFADLLPHWKNARLENATRTEGQPEPLRVVIPTQNEKS